jgi:hypothetical protein
VARQTLQLASTHIELGLLSWASATALEMLAAYSFEQGLTPRQLDLGEVFAPSTLDL